ncbi:MAG: hypothetical protein JO299_15215 [Gammaproteobacteria bacterium]|nr:hypothetical protein [Gammaproteobacteria bacterium]
MFIFSRPFRAVAAGLSVALVTVWLDRACEAPGTPDTPTVSLPAAAATAKALPPACAAPVACGIVRAGS